jgi:beta-1,4-mannosyltransferase
MPAISCYPEGKSENPYLDLYYSSLSRYGFHLSDPMQVQDSFLINNRSKIAILHIQWRAELLWRRWGWESHFKRIKGTIGLRNYFKLAKKLGYYLVWTLHDIESHQGDWLVDRLGYRVIAKWIDLCIAHDEVARDHFICRFGGDPSRVIVMPHGNYKGIFPESLPKQAVCNLLGIDDNSRILVCIGNIMDYKGFDIAVKAIRSLGEEYHLVVAGQPANDKICSFLCNIKGFAKNIHFRFGRFTNHDLSNYVSASDGVLLPYRKITGSGVAMTALTLGRGIIASDLPYFRGVLSDNPIAGVLITPGSVESLCEGIKRYYSIPIDQRCSAAYQIADKYDWDKVIKPVAERMLSWFPNSSVNVSQ